MQNYDPNGNTIVNSQTQWKRKRHVFRLFCFYQKVTASITLNRFHITVFCIGFCTDCLLFSKLHQTKNGPPPLFNSIAITNEIQNWLKSLILIFIIVLKIFQLIFDHFHYQGYMTGRGVAVVLFIWCFGVCGWRQRLFLQYLVCLIKV